jgi:hypothetical protein
MKSCHLRWIANTLTLVQKVVREELVKSMMEILASHAASNSLLRFVFPEDESWLLDASHIHTMWALCPENVDQIQRTSRIANQRMATVFLIRQGWA